MNIVPPPIPRRDSVAAVIVTRNRPADLIACIASVRSQTYPIDVIIVVDNASTDNTPAILSENPDLTVIRLDVNVGGAGGFRAGIEAASDTSCCWWWLMDDDCIPADEALEQLMTIANATPPDAQVAGFTPTILYGDERRLCGHVRTVDPASNERDGGPFLGLLLSGEACRLVGPVRDDFFIWADDTEYCLRLRMLGWRFLAVADAHISHPDLALTSISIGGLRYRVDNGPPWKQYYGARNNMLVNRYTRRTNVAAPRPRGGWLLRELVDYVALIMQDRREGPYRVTMRAYGRLDAIRGRTGFTVVPGQRVPFRLRRHINR